MIRDLRRRLRALAEGEGGIALPMALIVTSIGFTLATGAVLASVTSQRGTARDSDSKDAIAAADAGANVALVRLNQFSGQLSSSAPCVGSSGGTLVVTTASADGWCPEIKGTVGSSSYAYRVTPQTGGAMSVVASGAAGGVSRRVEISFGATTVGSALAGEGLIGEEKLTMSGNVQNVRVSVGTNGNLETNGNVTICGNIRYGVGKKWISAGNVEQKCGGTKTEETRSPLPPVSSFIPSNIATENSDKRLEKCTSPGVPSYCQTDGYVENGKESWSKSPLTNSAGRAPTLSVAGNTTITLGGSDYWLCRLSMEGNSHLIMAKGALVRIFFDTPEHCGLGSGTSQVKFAGNTSIEATGYGTEGYLGMPGLYLEGSPTITTSVELSGNSGTNELVVYGPNSAIKIAGNANYKGVMAGKTLEMAGNGYVTQDAGYEPPKVGGSTIYSRQDYVECVGAATSSPSSNC